MNLLKALIFTLFISKAYSYTCKTPEQYPELLDGLTRTLNSGAHGTIYRYILNERETVIKEIMIKDDQNLEDIQKEIDALSDLTAKDSDKSNVGEFIDCVIEENSRVLIIQEYLPEDLCTVIDRSYFDERLFANKLYYYLKLMKKVQFVHKSGYFHCDLKPENIMMKADVFDFKIIDFGSSDKERCIGGTPGYIPYEFFHEDMLTGLADAEKYDVFALGAIIMEIEEHPFPKLKFLKTLRNAYETEYKNYELVEAQFDVFVYYKKKFQTTNYYQSPEAREYLVSEFVDLLRKMLEKEVSKRITLDEAVIRMSQLYTMATLIDNYHSLESIKSSKKIVKTVPVEPSQTPSNKPAVRSFSRKGSLEQDVRRFKTLEKQPVNSKVAPGRDLSKGKISNGGNKQVQKGFKI